MFRSEFKESFYGGNVVIQDSSSRNITISKSGKLLSIKSDNKSKNLFPFYVKTEENLCKINDRIFFYIKSSTIYVFIIELKSSNINKAIYQVRAGYELSKYFINTALRLLNYPNIKIEYRGIIFSHKLLKKGTTKPKNLNYALDANYSKIKYKHLQSGQKYDLDSLAI